MCVPRRFAALLRVLSLPPPSAPEIYTLSLHDALPIFGVGAIWVRSLTVYMVRKGTLDTYKYLEHGAHYAVFVLAAAMLDRKSTRLNSSHLVISYAVFCLKKKKRSN